MWISIQTKGGRLSRRMRNRIERYLLRALKRQQGLIANIVVTISTTMREGDEVFSCRLRIWSHTLGVVVVSEFGPTVRTATQQATATARRVVRRRADKQYSLHRRMRRNRFARWSSEVALD